MHISSRPIMSDSSSEQSISGPSTPPTTPPESPRLRSVCPERFKLRAVWMRAGTSKGLFIHLEDLPQDRALWTPILLSAFGSPDPGLKQMNGVGGGVSTQSKVAIISPSSDPRADVDYLFCQVPVDGGELDFSGNCGNISSGVGPFAVEEGLFKVERPDQHEVTVRIRNVNTDRILHSTFAVDDYLPVEAGPFRLDGVSAPGSPIRLDFMDPAGAMTGRLLPSGSQTDKLEYEFDGTTHSVTVSLVDAANPFVFVPFAEVGLSGKETLAQLDEPVLRQRLMAIRAVAAVHMGLAETPEAAALKMGTPKIALIGAPSADSSCDILVRPYSMGKPHPSIQMTGAVCVGAAAVVPGTLINQITGSKASIVIGHGAGTMTVSGESEVVDEAINVKCGSLYRTARRLMEGKVMCRTAL